MAEIVSINGYSLKDSTARVSAAQNTADIKKLQDNIKDIQSTVNGTDVSLNETTEALGSQIIAVQTAATSAQTAAESAQTSADSAVALANANLESINGLNNALGTVNARIDEVDGKFPSLNSGIASLGSRTGAAESEILSIKTKLNDLSSASTVVPGENGKDGADGKSAYDIWLANGHDGSEADFLASLRPSTEELTALITEILGNQESSETPPPGIS